MKILFRTTTSTLLILGFLVTSAAAAPPADESRKKKILRIAEIAGLGVGTYFLSRKAEMRPFLAGDLLQGVVAGAISPGNGQNRWERVMSGYESGVLMSSGKRLSVTGINRGFTAFPGNAVSSTAGSMLENLRSGNRPFSRWRMSLGPVDVALRMSDEGVRVSPALDLASTGITVGNLIRGYRPDLRSSLLAGGTLVFKGPVIEKSRAWGVAGAGIVAIEESLDEDEEFKRYILGHEQTHVNQYRIDRFVGGPLETRLRLVRKNSPSWLKLDGLFSGLMAAAHQYTMDYPNRLWESEAYTITDAFYPGMFTGWKLLGTTLPQRLPLTFEAALIEKAWNPVRRPKVETVENTGNGANVVIRWQVRPHPRAAMDLIGSSEDHIVVVGPVRREVMRNGQDSGTAEFRDLLPGEYSATVERQERIEGRMYSKTSDPVRFTVK